MLVIRTEQMRVFEEESLSRYTHAVAAELREEMPRRCEELGDAGVLAWLAHGVERARGYGITSPEATGRYLRLMFLFGRDFDANPGLPWARAHLDDPGADQDAKVNGLTRAAHAYVAALVAARQGA